MGNTHETKRCNCRGVLCKAIWGFLNTQSTLTTELVGGQNWLEVNKMNPTGPEPATRHYSVVKGNQRISSAYKNSFGSDVVINTNANIQASPVNFNLVRDCQLSDGTQAIVTKSGFIGNTAVQDKLGDKAID